MAGTCFKGYCSHRGNQERGGAEVLTCPNNLIPFHWAPPPKASLPPNTPTGDMGPRYKPGTGKVAHQLGVLAALLEDWSLVPSIDMEKHLTAQNSSFRQYNTLSGFCRHLYPSAHIYPHSHTHAHKNPNKFCLRVLILK